MSRQLKFHASLTQQVGDIVVADDDDDDDDDDCVCTQQYFIGCQDYDFSDQNHFNDNTTKRFFPISFEHHNQHTPIYYIDYRDAAISHDV